MVGRNRGEASVAINLGLTPSERRVLDIIWRHGPIARTDIGPMTDLSTMSVTRITRELGDHGLLTEAVQRTGGRGQPARPLAIKADAAYAVGVYFSNRQIQIALIDLSGSVLERQTLAVEAQTPRDVAEAANAAWRGFRDGRGLDASRVAGMGFALPGDFISDRKRLNAHALFPGFRGEDLQAELQAHCDLEVHVENDAASAALGERLLGAGQTIESFFFAHIGHGIGGGLILDGRLYRGTSGNAGIIGVQFPNDLPRPSGQDLLETLARAGVAAADFDDLEALDPGTCAPLQAWIERAAGQLRQGLWITARMVDPEAIIIGGRLPRRLLDAVVARVDVERFCEDGSGLPRPRVLASALGPAAGVIGAAALPFQARFFSND